MSFYKNGLSNIMMEITEFNSSDIKVKYVDFDITSINNYTFKTSDDTSYIRLSIKRANSNGCSGTIKVQLEEGNTVTEYEDYYDYRKIED